MKSLIRESNDNQRGLSYLDLVFAVLFVAFGFGTGGWFGFVFILMSVYYVWSFFHRRVINITPSLLVPLDVLREIVAVEREANVRLQLKKEDYNEVMKYVEVECERIKNQTIWIEETEEDTHE